MLSQLSYNLALEIMSDVKTYFMDFAKRHEYNHYYMFTHYSFYYSYPEFGKKWNNTSDLCCFHKIETCCNECGYTPDRNYAGIGTLFITGYAPKVDGKFTLYCKDCVPGFNFSEDPRITNFNTKTKQLQLF